MSKPPFQHLVDCHWRDVARLAYGLAGSDGEDVAQQAWVSALDAYPSLKSTKNLRGWLLTITHRCAMDHFRRKSRSPLPVEDVTRVGAERSAAGADAHLPDEGLWQSVQALPERTRTAICLKYLADLDHRSIAEHLDVSPSMSRRLVSDGLKELRQIREKEGA